MRPRSQPGRDRRQTTGPVSVVFPGPRSLTVPVTFVCATCSCHVDWHEQVDPSTDEESRTARAVVEEAAAARAHSMDGGCSSPVLRRVRSGEDTLVYYNVYRVVLRPPSAGTCPDLRAGGDPVASVPVRATYRANSNGHCRPSPQRASLEAAEAVVRDAIPTFQSLCEFRVEPSPAVPYG